MTTPVTTSVSRLVVLLFTDIEGSTELKSRIGTSRYAELLARHNEFFETGVARINGAQIIKHTGDGYFATFPSSADAVRFALEFQSRMREESWGPQPLKTRLGIHVGEVQMMDMAGRPDVLGLSADLAARLMSLAVGGQILMTRQAFDDARQFVSAAAGTLDEVALKWLAHGPYLFKGADEPLDVFEVGIENASPLSRPPDSEKANRIAPHDQEPTLGWRPAVGQMIPKRPQWELTRKLSEGGFGEVWLAQHEKLKSQHVFKFCFDADRLRSLKREYTLFRLLKDALGDREDIVTLYEIKLDESPFYLESEYTAGGDLIEWAERRGGIDKIALPERLELIAKVADAVAAAHSVGILHKDLKPSNILINEKADGRIIPWLSDFGIGILTDRTQLNGRAITETGFTVLTQNDSSRTGTRMYSPPESLTNKPFTTQGDVYALGILLYQMAVCDLSRPLAPGWERDVTDELLREDIATMIEGDPARRTASAQEVASRIRGLESRRAEQQRQRTRKRRRRLAQTATVALAALVMVGGATAFFYIRSIRAEQRKTEAALTEVERQKTEAEKQKAEAERRREEAEAVNSFLTDDVLAKAGPDNLPDKAVRDVITQKLIDPAAAAVASRFKDKPLIEAAVRNSLQSTYVAIGRADIGLPHAAAALEIRRRLLGDDHADTLASINNMGSLLVEQGKFEAAEPLFREALERYRRVLGDDHPATLQSINNTGVLLYSQGKLAEAEPLYGEALERRRRMLGDDHPDTLITINNMGSLLQSQGKLAEAEPLYREALERSRRALGDDHPGTLISVHNMGGLLHSQGKLEAAEPLHREALERQRRVLGDDHPDTLTSINNMGGLLKAQGKLEAAEPLWREALERRRRVLGDDHPHTLSSINNMGGLLHSQGKLAEAEPLYREALERYRRVLGDDHPDTLSSINNMGALFNSQGKLEAAEPQFREALEHRRRVLGDDHPDTLNSINGLGLLLKRQGKLEAAEPLFREALERRRRVLGEDHPDTLNWINEMGVLLYSQGKLVEAEPLYREALERRQRVLGDDHPDTLTSINNMGFLLQAQGELEAAEPLYRDALERRRRVLGDDHPHTLISVHNMGFLLQAHGKLEAAEPLYREAATKAKTKLGGAHPQTKRSAANYAKCLDALGRHADAAAVRKEFDLPPPTTTTIPASQPSTQPAK